MGPPGAPFRLGPGAKCPSCPPPLWAALTDIEQMAQETLELKEKIAAERQASDDTAERRAKEQGWYHQITELNLAV